MGFVSETRKEWKGMKKNEKERKKYHNHHYVTSLNPIPL